MRKRIRQIARGKFEYEKPSLSLPDEELNIQVIEGQECAGNFTITSTNHVPVRGVVYSTSPRMECLTPQFEGEEVRIRYQFYSKGLVEGQEEKGYFVIVCNQSVYSLSFCVSITKLYAETSAGPVRNLYDFTCLARDNWSEAYQLFYHKSFANIIKAKEVKEALIYQGILGAKPSPQNMEEFLIGIRKKNKIGFSLDQAECRLDAVEETLQQSVEIKKDEWGYLELHVSSDADFIRLSEKKITTEDFLGSAYTLKYLIDYDKMHAGNNYGRIIVKSIYESHVLEVYAHKGTKTEDKAVSIRTEIRECKAGIMELYQA